MELRRGDLIEVHWADIYEDVTGDPDKAGLAARISVGYFWNIIDSQGLASLVTSTTIDQESSDQSGWCCYPLGTILKLKRIRKTRRKNVDASCVWTESPVEDLRVSERRGAAAPHESGDQGTRSGIDRKRDDAKAGTQGEQGSSEPAS